MKFTVYRLAGGVVLVGLAFWVMNVPEDIRRTIGISVAVASLFLLLLSRLHLGSSFTVKPEIRALVTKGLYARIQHPLYFFLDLMLWGLLVCFDLPWAFVLWGVLLLVHVFEARREERLLRSAFGEQYKAYQSRTWF
jgi:protein-S-isoprenylcysteine O-methyltransferase Ste14